MRRREGTARHRGGRGLGRGLGDHGRAARSRPAAVGDRPRRAARRRPRGDRRPHPPRDGRRRELRALPLRGALGRARRRGRGRAATRARAATAPEQHRSRLDAGPAPARGDRPRARAPGEPDGAREADRLAAASSPSPPSRSADLRAIGKTRPGHVTVNDVFLAGVAGGLRDWLAAGARRLPRLRAQIPVSLHHRGEADTELGNRDSYFNVDLPVARARPGRPAGADQRGDRAPQAARRRRGALRALPRPRAPSSPRPRRAADRGRARRVQPLGLQRPGAARRAQVEGRAVERLCSVAEPADRHALRICAISCGGNVGIGLCTDPEAVEGVAELAASIDAALVRARRWRAAVSVPSAVALKLGINLGYWGIGPQGPDAVEAVRAAEARGFDSVWVAESYGSDCVSRARLARGADRDRSSSARRSCRSRRARRPRRRWPAPRSTRSPAAASCSASAPRARRSPRAGTACRTRSRGAEPASTSRSCARSSPARGRSSTRASTTSCRSRDGTRARARR